MQALALAAVDVAAGDRRAAAVRIGVDRLREAREGGLVEEALGRRPAVIRAGAAEVDLLEGGLADIADKEVAEAAVEAVAERVAQAGGVEPGPGGAAGDAVDYGRIVGRDGVVPARIGREGVGVDIEAQDLAERGVEALRRPRIDAAVAGRDVEHVVGPKPIHPAR